MEASPECPCGGGAYADCCGPLLDGGRLAESAEELMRSRYTAFAVGDARHLLGTWHPRTRPHSVSVDGIEWTGLEIVDTVAGTPGDEDGVVEFLAQHRIDGRPGTLHERSRFARRAGRWLYLDGDG
ncbi:zinc chelation protein SecC [Naumannella sp. ID2617S]|nr:zinc chelation protein SecC [Naumannella sp. ID2617S]